MENYLKEINEKLNEFHIQNGEDWLAKSPQELLLT